MSWLLLIFSLISFAFTLNAIRPLKHRRLLWPAFFISWLTAELAPHHFILQGTVVALLIWAGGLESWPGQAGLGTFLASWAGLLHIQWVSRRATVSMSDALAEAELEPHHGAVPYPRLHLALPLLAFKRKDVAIRRDHVFWEDGDTRLAIDVYEGVHGSKVRRPALVMVHGGAFVVGYKRYQGVPLMGHLAANGWVCFNADYRLSPKATFPEHLIDVKRAVAWVRRNAERFGVDPNFIAVAGNSAGGHLASMTALTPDDPSYQPGFEHEDTSVQAAFSLYGVYDFTNQLGTRHPRYRTFLERVLLKRSYDEEPEAFRLASPCERVHAGAPPFLVIHGAADTLTPARDARHFVEQLRHVSHTTAIYVEIKGAQHAFDVLPSVRSIAVIEAAERFLTVAWRLHVAGQDEALVQQAAPELTEPEDPDDDLRLATSQS